MLETIESEVVLLIQWFIIIMFLITDKISSREYAGKMIFWAGLPQSRPNFQNVQRYMLYVIQIYRTGGDEVCDASSV